MYEPPHFRAGDSERVLAAIRAHPLGLIVSAGASGVLANPIPFELVVEAGRPILLRGHFARANPQWRDIAAAPAVLVVFQGIERYVSPAWYPTKRETGEVVPTWNYVMVQARGTARVRDDSDWLRRQVDALTAAREAGRPEPWAVSDAPGPFVARQLRAIVGVEIEVAELKGKFKLSQNRGEADQAGVRAGLAAEGAAHAATMAEMMAGLARGAP